MCLTVLVWTESERSAVALIITIFLFNAKCSTLRTGLKISEDQPKKEQRTFRIAGCFYKGSTCCLGFLDVLLIEMRIQSNFSVTSLLY